MQTMDHAIRHEDVKLDAIIFSAIFRRKRQTAPASRRQSG